MSQRIPVSRVVLEANRAFKSAQPETTEYEKLQRAFHDNRERLKSERLAREANTTKRGRKTRPSS